MTNLVAIYAFVQSVLGLPPGLLSAVCWVESRHQVVAINVDDGGSPSVGVCQVKEQTARLVGFTGSTSMLREPRYNIYYAGLYLQTQLKRYDGDARKAVAAYNAGTHKVNAEGLTINRDYVNRVFSAWAESK